MNSNGNCLFSVNSGILWPGIDPQMSVIYFNNEKAAKGPFFLFFSKTGEKILSHH
jgi:hypothetical protein